MKFEIFDQNKKDTSVFLKLGGTPNEIAIEAVDKNGEHKYSLLGIRSDGTFVSYVMDKEEKTNDGFKTNTQGQIVYFTDCKNLSRTDEEKKA